MLDPAPYPDHYGGLGLGRFVFLHLLVKDPESQELEISSLCSACPSHEKLEGGFGSLKLEALGLQLLEPGYNFHDQGIIAVKIQAELPGLGQDVALACKI